VGCVQKRKRKRKKKKLEKQQTLRLSLFLNTPPSARSFSLMVATTTKTTGERRKVVVPRRANSSASTPNAQQDAMVENESTDLFPELTKHKRSKEPVMQKVQAIYAAVTSVIVSPFSSFLFYSLFSFFLLFFFFFFFLQQEQKIPLSATAYFGCIMSSLSTMKNSEDDDVKAATLYLLAIVLKKYHSSFLLNLIHLQFPEFPLLFSAPS
jgi:hypothetical protein